MRRGSNSGKYAEMKRSWMHASKSMLRQGTPFKQIDLVEEYADMKPFISKASIGETAITDVNSFQAEEDGVLRTRFVEAEVEDRTAVYFMGKCNLP